MKPSPKQRIYIEIMETVLPACRSLKDLEAIGSMAGGVVLEADLLHNLPCRLIEPDFGEADLHWLNVDALSYVRQAAGQKRQLYGLLCDMIAELFSLVPQEMNSRFDRLNTLMVSTLVGVGAIVVGVAGLWLKS